jgi:hypothetical protein
MILNFLQFSAFSNHKFQKFFVYLKIQECYWKIKYKINENIKIIIFRYRIMNCDPKSYECKWKCFKTYFGELINKAYFHENILKFDQNGHL